MQTSGMCPRCGAALGTEQEGGLTFLRCGYCGYKERIETPAAPAMSQQVYDIEGIPGMPHLHISANLGDMSSQWMEMVSHMSQQGYAMPQYAHELTPERQEAAIAQVRAFMGDAMADQVAAAMRMAGQHGGLASGQPMVFSSVQTYQQPWGAQANVAGAAPGMEVIDVTQRRQGGSMKWVLLIGMVTLGAICLMALVGASLVMLR